MSRKRIAIEHAVLRAWSGDADAFALLVDECHETLVRHASRWLADRDLVRDAVQDAWCSIVRGIRRLDDPAQFLPWALAIAARRACDVARRCQRQPRAEPIATDELPATAATAADALDGRDENERLRAAVAGLDFDHRVVVELHYRDELSLPEIAATLDVPLGTVKSRLFHARTRLRRALGGRDDDPTDKE